MADGSTELDVNLEVLFSISEQESSAACYQPDEHSEKGNRPKAVDFKLTSENCFLCELEHNSPEFGPYCAVCHDFLYPNAPLVLGTETEDSHLAASCESVSSQSATCDSSETIISSGGSAESEDPEDSGCESENETKLSPENSERPLNPSSMSLSKLPYLSLYEHIRPQNFIAERLANELSFVEEDLFGKLPPEMLLIIFSFLDDISLCMVGQVCQWWQELAGEHNEWEKHVRTRWPLLPCDKQSSVKSWQKLYMKLLQSVACRRCFEQGCVQHSPEDKLINSWRNKRLKSELRGILMDPPEGIRARPLDNSLSYWQASIKGPPNCPYEGGLFFLHLEIPKSYPMRPPIPRFITKIFHPNISYHGDIGVDMLGQNWSLALTIPKVLVSIQSLLTDPNCHICMESDIAQLYENDREQFDRVAREWTIKYAQLHMSC